MLNASHFFQALALESLGLTVQTPRLLRGITGHARLLRVWSRKLNGPCDRWLVALRCLQFT